MGDDGCRVVPAREWSEGQSLAALLAGYSAEITVRDAASIRAATDEMALGAEVFVAALPADDIGQMLAAIEDLKRAGLDPVPHLVARNIPTLEAADDLLARLSAAGVDRVLALGGDRDRPAGALTESLDLIESGLLQKHGVRDVFIGCYPEGHPRIAAADLRAALHAKLGAAARGGLNMTLVSQFCFDSSPIINFAGRLRDEGVTTPLRVGVAGPADRARLLKYAMICGVGRSMRFLKGRTDLAKGVLSAETPETLLTDLAKAQVADPGLGLAGIHFFTFGGLGKSARWANAMLARAGGG